MNRGTPHGKPSIGLGHPTVSGTLLLTAFLCLVMAGCSDAGKEASQALPDLSDENTAKYDTQTHRTDSEPADGRRPHDLNDATSEVADGKFDGLMSETADGNGANEVADGVQACPEGAPCDDNDPCTFSDHCVAGTCEGTPYSCDDARQCTDDICDGGGSCLFVVVEDACLINNVCRLKDDVAALNDCFICLPDNSHVAWSMAPNGTACGLADLCLNEGTCTSGDCDALPKDCDDDNPCTDDFCLPEEGCTHEPNFDLCEDGDPCTLWDKCSAGECAPGPMPLDCDDDNPCTNDLCSADGCINIDHSGPCDDGDICTFADVCSQGECISGIPLSCEDNNECTEDFCEQPAGCVHISNDNPCCMGLANVCDDDDDCTIDNCDLDNGDCLHEAHSGACNNGDACTGPDMCTAGTCSGPPVDCNDGKPCTQDSCDPDSGCQHQIVDGECDDGNSCTENDICQAGQCKGKAVDCSDNSPCTNDWCDFQAGCTHEAFDGPCDDKDACTSNDACAGGACSGTPVQCEPKQCHHIACHVIAGCQYTMTDDVSCDDSDPCTQDDYCQGGVCIGGQDICGCQYDASHPANRVNKMAFVPDKASSLDINGDGKPDNSLGFILDFALNGEDGNKLQDSLDNGSIHLLFHHREFKTDGSSYELAALLAVLSPENPGCAFQSATCDFFLQPGSLDQDTCEPLIQMENASISGVELSAGGSSYEFVWQFVMDEKEMNVTLANAHIRADIEIKQGQVTKMIGVLAGALPEAELETLIEAAADENGCLADCDGQKPIMKDFVIGLLAAANDIDTNNDGNPDAASMAFAFEAIPAGITEPAP